MERTKLVEWKITQRDGRLYYNPLLNITEALIQNPWESCHASDLLELQNGDLLCCWFAGSTEGNGDISIAMSRLPAGKSTWTMPIMVTDDVNCSEQNPSLFLAPNGEIWMIYTAQQAKQPKDQSKFNLQYTAEIRRKRSKDNGNTWGDTEVMFHGPGTFCRQKIQVLSNGRWIFGTWICFADDTRNGSDIPVIWISDDQGSSWRSIDIPESKGRVHGNIIENEPGKLVVFFRSRFADYIYLSKSDDNGETWSVPVRTELPNNNSSISAIKLKSGSIGIIYNPVHFNEDVSKVVWPRQRCPIAIAISKDGGESFPWQRIVEMGEGFTGSINDCNNLRYEYPVMIQGKDSRMHAAYSWGTRRNIKYICLDESWVCGGK